jgi:hypothetical protein
VQKEGFGRSSLNIFKAKFEGHALVDINHLQYGTVTFSLMMVCGTFLENQSLWKQQDNNGEVSWWRHETFKVCSTPMSLLWQGLPPVPMPFDSGSQIMSFRPGDLQLGSGNTLSIDWLDPSILSQHSQNFTAPQNGSLVVTANQKYYNVDPLAFASTGMTPGPTGDQASCPSTAGESVADNPIDQLVNAFVDSGPSFSFTGFPLTNYIPLDGGNDLNQCYSANGGQSFNCDQLDATFNSGCTMFPAPIDQTHFIPVCLQEVDVSTGALYGPI